MASPPPSVVPVSPSPAKPSGPDPATLRRRILIRSPEIRIKGRNRASFREALKRNLGRRLLPLGRGWRASSAGDRVWVEVPGVEEADLDRALDAVRTVFGVQLALPAFVLPRADEGGPVPAERLAGDALELTCRLASAGPPSPGAGFALRVRRRDKSFPAPSQRLADDIGRAVLDRTPWERVDLDDPAFTVWIEAHKEAVYVWTRRVSGPGGLPVGAASRLLALLSGGFDSPVAAWMVGGRGCPVDFVHLTPGRPDPEEPSSRKAIALVRSLSRFTGLSRLVLVPYTRFDLGLVGSRTGYEALLFRRFAFRCGEAVARRFGAGALVTGDSLSQVASQTLENLISADRAVTMPVLRPLIGMDKAAIMGRAEAIGTWPLSAVPAKDCCALISRAPRTRSRPRRVAQLDRRLFPDPVALVRESLAESLVGAFEFGELAEPFVPPPRFAASPVREPASAAP